MKKNNIPISVKKQIEKAVAHQRNEKTRLKNGVGSSMLLLKNIVQEGNNDKLDKKLHHRYYNHRSMRLNSYEIEYINAKISYDYNAIEVEINNEKCKRIIEFTYYVISNSGRIYRTVPVNHRELFSLVIKPYLTYFIEKTSYIRNNRSKRISLTNEFGTLYNLMLSRLVFQYFGLKNNPNNNALEHKDNDISNCHIDNLVLTDKHHTLARLNIKQVNQIKRLIKYKYSLRSISLLYNVSEMTIGRIRSGETRSKRGRIIPPKKVPFYVADPKIRRTLSYFEFEFDEKIQTVKSKFKIIRNPNNATDNKISGIYKGYKMVNYHLNITRAKTIVTKLNEYFYE